VIPLGNKSDKQSLSEKATQKTEKMLFAFDEKYKQIFDCD